jgi:hypothetical protein
MVRYRQHLLRAKVSRHLISIAIIKNILYDAKPSDRHGTDNIVAAASDPKPTQARQQHPRSLVNRPVRRGQLRRRRFQSAGKPEQDQTPDKTSVPRYFPTGGIR